MDLRNKLHPLVLSPDSLSKLAKKYGHFQKNISLEAFCRDLSKFTEFEPWQLHQALYKMLNAETISWSSFLELLKDDCKTRSSLITQLLDNNQAFSVQFVEHVYKNVNNKLPENQEVRSYNRIYLHNHCFSLILLNNQLLVVQQNEKSVVSRLVFLPEVQSDKRTQGDKLQEGQKSKVQAQPSTMMSSLKRSIRISSDRMERSKKVEKKGMASILDMSIDESVHGVGTMDDIFDHSGKTNHSAVANLKLDHMNLGQSQFDPWKFIGGMKTTKNKLTYDPHNVIIQKSYKSFYRPRDKEVFNRALTLNKKIATSNIPIECFSVELDYVAIILTNKQLRLLQLKKYPFNKIVTELIVVKTFKFFPTFVHLFRTILNDSLHILIAFQSDKKTKLKAYKLILEHDNKSKADKTAKLLEVYSEDLNFCPLYQPMGNFLAMFNYLGVLSVLDLTCRDHETLYMKVDLKIQNPYLNKTIPVSACAYHAHSFTIIIGCKDGYLHTLSQHSPQPKRHKKITNCQVSAIACGLQYIVALTTDLQCLLFNPYSLAEMSKLDLGDYCLKGIFQLFKVQDKDSIVIFGSSLQRIDLALNQVKVKQIRRSKYEHMTKVKLLDNEFPAIESLTQDSVYKVKASEEFLIVMLQDSNIVKVFSSPTCSTSFIPELETTSIIDVAMQKHGNLIAIAYDSLEVEVRNIHTQSIVWRLTLGDFPNCLLFINRDSVPMVNVNTEQGNINLIDSKGILRTLHSTKTSLTTAGMVRSNLVVGDCFGALYVFTQTSMMLLHKIMTGLQSIKTIRDVQNAKLARILTFGNVIYDVDIHNAKVLMVTHPKCTTGEVVHDTTTYGFVQQTQAGIMLAGVGHKKETVHKEPALRQKISSRSKQPTIEQALKSMLSMAVSADKEKLEETNYSLDKLYEWRDLKIQRQKVSKVCFVMGRVVVVQSNCMAVFVGEKEKLLGINLLD